MAEDFNFEKALQEALEEKVAWFDSNVMVEMLDNYRVLYSAVNNVMGLLLQKGLITPDPYKLDKKISDVVILRINSMSTDLISTVSKSVEIGISCRIN